MDYIDSKPIFNLICVLIIWPFNYYEPLEHVLNFLEKKMSMLNKQTFPQFDKKTYQKLDLRIQMEKNI